MKFVLILLVLLGTVLAGPSLYTKSSSADFIRSDGVLSSSQVKIIGGSDAIRNELPWQVSIQVKPIFGDNYHNCGGTIINPTHIITAAHCLEGQVLNQISIVAGAHNVKVSEPTQQIRTPTRLIWNDNFDSYLLTHDVGVITLSQPLVFNENVSALKISDEGVEPSGECINSGWGNSNPSGGTPILIPDALQKVKLEIIPRANCSVAYGGINEIDDTMICARGLQSFTNIGSCNGDSGGPLVCLDNVSKDYYLAGLVSWGMNPCGQYDYPTVFGNVANKAMRDFIITESNRP